ncbi:rhamnose ABC transporter substrate-binding protein [Deinococcus hohokamensis]|uniref:Rhamnose ABC transporter substrate-binding protein n=1 Tax=Deinococcus hohokamensis TaxID=309883 RepID=A0ABV9IE57_9DEIO
MKHRNVLLAALTLTLGAALAQPALQKGITIAFLPKQVNNPYFTTAWKGGQAAIKEFAGVGKQVGPSDAGASSQVSYINTLLAQRQKAIVVSASDTNALVPYLKRAMSQGVKVVTYDSDVAKEGRHLFVSQASADTIARDEVKLLAKQIGNKGEIAILSATPNATNQNAWIKVMQDELKKPQYKNMKLVKIAYGNDDDQKSFTEMQGLMQAYPNLKGVISPTTVGISAAARYLSGSPYKGKVALTGLGTPNQMREFVKNGTVQGFALWNPEDLGYLASYAAAALVSGQITGKEGDKFSAGKLGQRTVGKDGVVILGPLTVFDKSNIDKFSF